MKILEKGAFTNEDAYLLKGFQKMTDFIKNHILLVINKKMIIIIVRLECDLNWSEDTL